MCQATEVAFAGDSRIGRDTRSPSNAGCRYRSERGACAESVASGHMDHGGARRTGKARRIKLRPKSADSCIDVQTQTCDHACDQRALHVLRRNGRVPAPRGHDRLVRDFLDNRPGNRCHRCVGRAGRFCPSRCSHERRRPVAPRARGPYRQPDRSAQYPCIQRGSRPRACAGRRVRAHGRAGIARRRRPQDRQRHTRPSGGRRTHPGRQHGHAEDVAPG